MKKAIVTQGCFLLLCSMFAANAYGDEPGVARISNRKANNIQRAIFQTEPNAPTQVKKAGFLSTVRSKLSWKSKDCCDTGKNCCTKTKDGCCKTKGACCNTKGSCCKTNGGGCNNGTVCCRGNGCGQAGCNSCNGCRGLKRFFSFAKCKCGCGQRGCRCSHGFFGNGTFGHRYGNAGRTLCAPWGCYSVVYPVDPFYFDRRDTKLFSAQGYGSPVSVPLAPNVRHTYNYGWGIPSSRLTPISRPGAHVQVIQVNN